MRLFLFNGCVVCADDYGVSDILSGLGIDLIHTGELLTSSLQSDDIKVLSL